MSMQNVKSSNIAAIGYREAEQLCVVRFKSKVAWRFKGVPKQLFEQFLTAKSLGSFFAAKIKNAFKGEKMTEEEYQAELARPDGNQEPLK